MPTFDEWFKAKYGSTFERLHQASMTPYDHTVRALTEATREYVTEAVAPKSTVDHLTLAQRQIEQLTRENVLLRERLEEVNQREWKRVFGLLRFS